MVDENKLVHQTHDLLNQYIQQYQSIDLEDKDEYYELQSTYTKYIINLWFPMWSDVDSWSNAEDIDLTVKGLLQTLTK